MRTPKYGISAKLVANKVTVLLGVNCDERSARAALAQYYDGGMVFKSVDAAAQAIASYHRAHGKFPRKNERVVSFAEIDKPTGFSFQVPSPAVSIADAVDALRRAGIHSITFN